MVAFGVLSGTPSHAGDGEPTSSTFPCAVSRSNSLCGINIAEPVRKTKAVQLRPTFWGEAQRPLDPQKTETKTYPFRDCGVRRSNSLHTILFSALCGCRRATRPGLPFR